MFSTPYPSNSEYQAHMIEARRLRAAFVASFFAQIGRRLADLVSTGRAPTGRVSAAAR